jgi:hypothetical protein
MRKNIIGMDFGRGKFIIRNCDIGAGGLQPLSLFSLGRSPTAEQSLELLSKRGKT